MRSSGRLALLEAVPQLVWATNAEGSLSYVNQRFLRYYGITFETLRDRPESLVHPDDLGPLRTAFAAAEARRESFYYEVRIRRADGAYRWHAIQGNRLTDPDGRFVGYVGTNTDVDDRKRAADEQVAQDEHLRLIAEAIPQIVWTARPDGWLDYYNQRWFEYTGMSLEQTQGWGWSPVVHPDDLPACVERWSHAVTTGQAYDIEHRFRRAADGVYRWHLGRALPIRDGAGNIVKWFGTCTDIDDQKRAGLRLAGIVESSPDAIIGLRFDGTIDSWNSGAERLYGWSAEEVRGRAGFETFLPPAVHDPTRRNMSRLRTGSGRLEPFESCHQNRGGKEFPVTVSCAVIAGDDGRPEGFSMIARDISAAKATEAQVRASLAEKEVLLMEVHHRVKNNLQVVCSLLSLQSSQTRDPATLAIFTDMENRVRTIALAHEKLYQARDLSRIDLGDHLRDIVHGLLRTFGTALDGPEIDLDLDEVKVSVETAIPCGLIVNELVTNSLRYAFVGGRAGTITVTLRSDGERHLLDVADDGVGLDPEPTRKKSLGLHLVHSLVRQLGGMVRVGPRPGTSFQISFGRRRTRRSQELRPV